MAQSNSSRQLPANQSFQTKDGRRWTTVTIMSYFAGIRRAMKVKDPFPIDFDHVWPLAYARKDHAKRALKRLGFVEGTHYRILLPQPEERDPKLGAAGANQETIMLSVAAAEHIVIEKVPQVREAYRKVFHEWFDAKETKKLVRRDQIRLDGKDVRKKYVAVAMDHGVRRVGRLTNSGYQGLARKNASDFPKINGSTRDAMPEKLLAAVSLQESTTGEIIEDQDLHGEDQICRLAFGVGDQIRKTLVDLKKRDWSDV